MTKNARPEYVGGPCDGDEVMLARTQQDIITPTVGQTTRISGTYRYHKTSSGDYEFIGEVG